MKRLHLFEFHEVSWVPRPFRQAITSYLQALYQGLTIPDLWTNRILKVLKHYPKSGLLDLCSGGTGPMLLIQPEISKNKDIEIKFSDFYPNKEAIERVEAKNNSRLTYLTEAVNATSVPKEHKDVRTIFSAFHHFKPKEAQQILEDVYMEKQGICIFEITANKPIAWLSTLIAPVLVLLFTPKLRPLTPFQLVFTYIIPLLPLMIGWDCLVSHLRTYSEEDYRNFVRPMSTKDYHWEVGSIPLKGFGYSCPYLLGYQPNPPLEALEESEPHLKLNKDKENILVR